MIVPPKLYKKLSRDNTQIQLGGYLLNDIEYTDDIFIDNWELKQKTTVLSQNIIYWIHCMMPHLRSSKK